MLVWMTKYIYMANTDLREIKELDNQKKYETIDKCPNALFKSVVQNILEMNA